MKLINKAVGSVLFEELGPVTDLNRFSSVSPDEVIIKVVGSGAVQLYSNSTPILSSSAVELNPSGVQRNPDPAGWSTVGTPIDETDGETTLAIATAADLQWIRLVVSTAGTGKVYLVANWR